MRWLKDFLGINRYAIEWRRPSVGGYFFTGRSDTEGCATMSKRVAIVVASEMNQIYGNGTHWVVPVQEPAS